MSIHHLPPNTVVKTSRHRDSQSVTRDLFVAAAALARLGYTYDEIYHLVDMYVVHAAAAARLADAAVQKLERSGRKTTVTDANASVAKRLLRDAVAEAITRLDHPSTLPVADTSPVRNVTSRSKEKTKSRKRYIWYGLAFVGMAVIAAVASSQMQQGKDSQPVLPPGQVDLLQGQDLSISLPGEPTIAEAVDEATAKLDAIIAKNGELDAKLKTAQVRRKRHAKEDEPAEKLRKERLSALAERRPHRSTKRSPARPVDPSTRRPRSGTQTAHLQRFELSADTELPSPEDVQDVGLTYPQKTRPSPPARRFKVKGAPARDTPRPYERPHDPILDP